MMPIDVSQDEIGRLVFGYKTAGIFCCIVGDDGNLNTLGLPVWCLLGQLN